MENRTTKKIDITSYKAVLFDLDDTLYPHNNRLWEQIRNRIEQFMREELHFKGDKIPALRDRLWRTYGTTLRGLQTEFHVDMVTYLEYVHAIPLEKYLGPEPRLARILDDFPQPKFIFTNSDRSHAQRVLTLLDIAEHFDQIIDIYAMAPYCKPQAEAFQIALDIVGENPEDCLFIDDSPVNLTMAQQLGMTTISVGQHPHAGSPQIPTLCNLPDLLALST